MNENYAQPSLPAGIEEDLIRGMYRHGTHSPATPIDTVRLVGSGAILREVIAAAELPASDWQVAAEVWSATSARRFFEVDRHHVALAAHTALRTRGHVDAATCAEAMRRYRLSPHAPASWDA